MSLTCIHPGRSLALSPEWHPEEPSVLFDRHSGDYWVIPGTTRLWVEHLLDTGGPINTESLHGVTQELTPEEFDAALKQLVTLDIFRVTSE